MEGIKSYQSCLEELRESTGYNEHMELGNKFIARTYDEIIRVLADVMILNEDDTVTINQKSYPHIQFKRGLEFRFIVYGVSCKCVIRE